MRRREVRQEKGGREEGEEEGGRDEWRREGEEGGGVRGEDGTSCKLHI